MEIFFIYICYENYIFVESFILTSLEAKYVCNIDAQISFEIHIFNNDV